MISAREIKRQFDNFQGIYLHWEEQIFAYIIDDFFLYCTPCAKVVCRPTTYLNDHGMASISPLFPLYGPRWYWITETTGTWYYMSKK